MDRPEVPALTPENTPAYNATDLMILSFILDTPAAAARQGA